MTAGRASPRLGVCSWSLSPTSAADLAEKVRATGLRHIQLALDPIRRGEWDEAATIDALSRAGVSAVSAMMAMEGEDYSTLDSIKSTGGLRPSQTWEANLRAAHDNAALARRLGLSLVTFHAGFIPHDRSDPEREIVIGRVRQLNTIFRRHGVRVAMETGQENAETLVVALADLGADRPGVNFDPANMILYGMGDPLAALKRVAMHVAQIHIKDALPTEAPGTWGSEVRVGEGAVDWRHFFDLYRRNGLTCDLLIEREAGDARVADIAHARTVVLSHMPELDQPGA